MSDPTEFIGYPTRLIGLAWHDVTCPEGPECRSRDLHAASEPLAVSGHLERFLHRLFEVVADSHTRKEPEIEEQLCALDTPKSRWWWPAHWGFRTLKG
jgi:hypothetical protein